MSQNDPIEEESKETETSRDKRSARKSSVNAFDEESVATKKTRKKSKKRDDSAS